MRKTTATAMLGVALIFGPAGQAETLEAVRRVSTAECGTEDAIVVEIATPWKVVAGCITGLVGIGGRRLGRFKARVPIRPVSNTVSLSIVPETVVLADTVGGTLVLSDFQVADPDDPLRHMEDGFFKEVIVTAEVEADTEQSGIMSSGGITILITEHYQ